MPRLPLLSGSRVLAVQVPDDTVVLSAPPPVEPLADVAAAVGEALRFPLSGLPIEALTTRGGRATVVVDPPSLPFPDARDDPRRQALAAVLDELERTGIPAERQTVLVAGGLERRAGRRELEELLPPARARDFRGTVVVHDVEDETLRHLGDVGGAPLTVAPSLLDTDLVVVVTAAETVLHGGPAALHGACGPPEAPDAGAESLLEPATATGWRRATALESLLGRRTPLIGVSLVLDRPRPAGRYHGWPSDRRTLTRIAGSPLRRVHNLAPGTIRRRTLDGLDRSLSPASALAGPPSVAHAEALLRGTELRAARLDGQLDAIVVPVPWRSAHYPRTTVDPIAAAHLGLGIALRLWREQPPLVDGGTVVLLHGFRPAFDRPVREPYRALYEALRDPSPEHLATVAELARRERRAIESYRAGRAPHPLLPLADWEACRPVRDRAGRVIVGGCRDATAAKRLGFVPSHSAQAAIEMALGVAGPGARIGVLVAPPYPALVVG